MERSELVHSIANSSIFYEGPTVHRKCRRDSVHKVVGIFCYIVLDKINNILLVILIDQNKPVILIDQNKSVMLINQNKPVILIDQNKPVILIKQNKPVILTDQNKPAILIDQNKPAILIDLYKPNPPDKHVL